MKIMRHDIYIYPVTFIISALILTSCGETDRKTIERGEEIIEVLERFKIDSGSYPAALQNLVPHYINEIPNTFYVGAKNKYFYRRKDCVSKGDCFELWYNAPFGVQVRYKSATGEWEGDD